MKTITICIMALMLNLSAMADFSKGFFAAQKGDYKQALIEYEASASQGDIESQLVLANIYYYGTSVPTDYQKAIDWFQQAAKQKHPEAQYSLGMIYAEGKGVAQDLRQAKNWLQKAINNPKINDVLFAEIQQTWQQYQLDRDINQHKKNDTFRTTF